MELEIIDNVNKPSHYQARKNLDWLIEEFEVEK